MRTCLRVCECFNTCSHNHDCTHRSSSRTKLLITIRLPEELSPQCSRQQDTRTRNKHIRSQKNRVRMLLYHRGRPAWCTCESRNTISAFLEYNLRITIQSWLFGTSGYLQTPFPATMLHALEADPVLQACCRAAEGELGGNTAQAAGMTTTRASFFTPLRISLYAWVLQAVGAGSVLQACSCAPEAALGAKQHKQHTCRQLRTTALLNTCRGVQTS